MDIRPVVRVSKIRNCQITYTWGIYTRLCNSCVASRKQPYGADTTVHFGSRITPRFGTTGLGRGSSKSEK